MINTRTEDLSDDPHRLFEFAGLTSFGCTGPLPLSQPNGLAATTSGRPGRVTNSEMLRPTL